VHDLIECESRIFKLTVKVLVATYSNKITLIQLQDPDGERRENKLLQPIREEYSRMERLEKQMESQMKLGFTSVKGFLAL
jgi:hypothetical protein